jgi:hypothetical protein
MYAFLCVGCVFCAVPGGGGRCQTVSARFGRRLRRPSHRARRARHCHLCQGGGMISRSTLLSRSLAIRYFFYFLLDMLELILFVRHCICICNVISYVRSLVWVCLMCLSPARTVERCSLGRRVPALRSHYFGHDRFARSRRVDSRLETTADAERYADFKEL